MTDCMYPPRSERAARLIRNERTLRSRQLLWRSTSRFAKLGLGLAASIAFSNTAAAQSASPSLSTWLTPTPMAGWAPPSTFNFDPIAARSSWKVGAFAGEFNGAVGLFPVIYPTGPTSGPTWAPGYIAGADAVYTAINFPKIPLNFELDFSASAHFGNQEFAEFAVVPAVRWTWFPWNNWIYTNFRIGAGGPSVTTALSTLEANRTKNKYTTYFLAGGLEEVTFAPSRESPWEVFVRIHHRSGVFGLIDGVSGGSNYVTFGWRTQL
jgi:hypothetical protein